jgi:DNA-binding PadR family transcriptional regulator
MILRFLVLRLTDRASYTERRILEAIGNDELSGAQIMKRGRFWLPPYPALLRLESKGILTSRWIEQDYPRRRVYRLKQAGRAS